MIAPGSFRAPPDGGFTGATTVVAIVVFAIVLAQGLDACTARADEEPAHVTLARTCVSEASWNAIESGDCAAIAAVAKRVGRGDVARGLRLYARSAHNQNRRDARRWVAFLGNYSALSNSSTEANYPEAPEGWPAHLSWERHAPYWQHVLDGAQRILSGEIQHRCTETPWHWGGAMDRWRAVRNRWRQIDCGPTHNEFWVLR